MKSTRQWFAKRFSKALNAEKTLVKKVGISLDQLNQMIEISAYQKLCPISSKMCFRSREWFSRLDMDENGELLLIDFNRIKGEKPFDHKEKWFVDILRSIGQID